MSLPSKAELHQAILDYLTRRSRIMFAHRLDVWDEFHAHSNYKYADYSHEDLRDEFTKVILPKVLTFELTDVQKRKIEIFTSHYLFTPTTHGFRERKPRRRGPVEGVDFVNETNAAQFPHISVVVREPETSHNLPRPDVKIAAWASAVNSTDAELAEFSFHRGSRLHSRVEQNVRHCRETGECPQNLNPFVGRKIIGFRHRADELSAMSCEDVLGEKEK